MIAVVMSNDSKSSNVNDGGGGGGNGDVSNGAMLVAEVAMQVLVVIMAMSVRLVIISDVSVNGMVGLVAVV